VFLVVRKMLLECPVVKQDFLVLHCVALHCFAWLGFSFHCIALQCVELNSEVKHKFELVYLWVYTFLFLPTCSGELGSCAKQPVASSGLSQPRAIDCLTSQSLPGCGWGGRTRAYWRGTGGGALSGKNKASKYE
jgi:hypothetical protein